jgi:hypothetical protein
LSVLGRLVYVEGQSIHYTAVAFKPLHWYE